MPKRNEGARLRWFQERGAFYICWTVKHRSRKCSTGTADREQAEAFLADWLRDRGAGPRPSDPSQSLITDCLSRYAQEHGPDVVGQETLGRAILNLVEFWQERVVSEITPILCKRYCTVRAVSNGTARRELGVLQAAVNWAYNNGRLTRTVAVALPEKPESKTRWLTRSEAARLLKASKTPDARAYMPLFILIGLYTGRRKEAILSLRWPQIDFTTGIIDFDIAGRKRTKKVRGKCPIPSKLMPHLIRARARGGDMGFVINRHGKPIGDIKKGFQGACRRAGLGDDVTPHTLRHTAVTWRLNARVPVWDVAGLVGMSTRTLMDIYGHHSDDALQDAANSTKRTNGAHPRVHKGNLRVV
jgi:integrase